MSRTAWGVIAGIAGVFLITAAIVLFGSQDKWEFDKRAAVANAARSSGSASTITGTVRGTEINQMNPWSALLEVATDDGKRLVVAINAHTHLSVGERVPLMPDSESSDAFPWRVSDLRVKATVKQVKAGPLGLKPELVATDAAITHP